MHIVKQKLTSSWVPLTVIVIILVVIVVFIFTKTEADANTAINLLNASTPPIPGTSTTPPVITNTTPAPAKSTGGNFIPYSTPPAAFDPSTGAMPVTVNDAQVVLLDPNASSAQQDAAEAIVNQQQTTSAWSSIGF